MKYDFYYWYEDDVLDDIYEDSITADSEQELYKKIILAHGNCEYEIKSNEY